MASVDQITQLLNTCSISKTPEDRKVAADELAKKLNQTEKPLLVFNKAGLMESIKNKKDVAAKETSLDLVASIAAAMGQTAMPYLITNVPLTLDGLADKQKNVARAAKIAFQAIYDIVVAAPNSIKAVFGRWSTEDVNVSDVSLVDFIGVKGKFAVWLPHTAGRYQAKSFRKAQCPIVERLITAMMFHGRNNGKKQMAQKIVKHTCEIIHLVTGGNPLQIIADAVAKSGPREDSTRIGSSGVVRRQAVDVSPLRRVNQAIYLITTGARNTAFRNIKSVAECLADELINAANDNGNSYAIKKKDEIERVAKANR
jgi:small subunit ribosomal protein S5e